MDLDDSKEAVAPSKKRKEPSSEKEEKKVKKKKNKTRKWTESEKSESDRIYHDRVLYWETHATKRGELPMTLKSILLFFHVLVDAATGLPEFHDGLSNYEVGCGLGRKRVIRNPETNRFFRFKYLDLDCMTVELSGSDGEFTLYFICPENEEWRTLLRTHIFEFHFNESHRNNKVRGEPRCSGGIDGSRDKYLNTLIHDKKIDGLSINHRNQNPLDYLPDNLEIATEVRQAREQHHRHSELLTGMDTDLPPGVSNDGKIYHVNVVSKEHMFACNLTFPYKNETEQQKAHDLALAARQEAYDARERNDLLYIPSARFECKSSRKVKDPIDEGLVKGVIQPEPCHPNCYRAQIRKFGGGYYEMKQFEFDPKDPEDRLRARHEAEKYAKECITERIRLKRAAGEEKKKDTSTTSTTSDK